MNRFLRELLYEIKTDTPPDFSVVDALIEDAKKKSAESYTDESGKTRGHPQIPDGLYHGGGGRYYTTPRGTTQAAAGEFAGTFRGGKWTSAKQDTASTKDKPEGDDSEQPDSPEKKTQGFISKVWQNAKVLAGLIDAIRLGDAGRIKEEINRLQIARDDEGRLVIGTAGIGYGVFGKRGETPKEAADELEKLISPHGITLQSVREIVASRAEADAFKPQKLGVGTGRAETKVFPENRGFSVAGVDYTKVPVTSQLIEKIKAAFIKLGMSEKEATAEAKKIGYAIGSHNAKITILSKEMARRDDAFDTVTDRNALASALAEKVIEAAGDNITDVQKNALKHAFSQLASADTTEEFDAQWSGNLESPRARGTERTTGDREILSRLLLKTGLSDNSMAALCESIEVLRKSVGGGQVLIPRRQNYELVDLIVLRPPVRLTALNIDNVEDFTDEFLQQLQLVNVQVEMIGVKSGRGKGKGRASAVQTRILLTEFDSPEVREDLLNLVGTPAHTALWECKTEEEFQRYSQKQLTGLMPYINDITEYYGLEKQTEGKDESEKLRVVFSALSRGTLPRYDANGNFIGAGQQSSAFEDDAAHDKTLTELNRHQLRLFSFIGYAADAIYNRRATLQGFTNTNFGDSAIKETDGNRQMARSAFHFFLGGEWSTIHGQKVYRTAFGYTSYIENTDSRDDLQKFSTRTKGRAVNELLVEAMVGSDELRKIKFTYVSPKTQKKVPVSALTVKDTGKSHPAWPQYQALLKIQPPSDSIRPIKSKKSATGTPKKPASNQGKKRNRESVNSILGKTATHPTAKDKNGNPLKIRYIVDENGNEVDTSTDDGRRKALEIINQHITSVQTKTIDACKNFTRNQKSKQWLGGIGEIYAYKEILEAGADAYLAPDSNPESDIIIINRAGEDQDLKIIEISVKSSLGENVGQMGANARTIITKMVEGKTSNFDPTLGDVSATAAINAIYDVREVLGRIISHDAVTGDVGKKTLDLSEEQLSRCTPEYQRMYRENAQTTGGHVKEVFSLYERNRLITEEDLATYEVEILKHIERKYKKYPQVIDERKRLAAYYLKKLRQEISDNPGYTMVQLQDFIIKNMGVVSDNTNPPTDVKIESDLIGIQFNAETGIPTINLAKADNVKRCVDSKTGSSGTRGRIKWEKQLTNYTNISWRPQARVGRRKDRGYIQFKMNWAPEKDCTKKSWQSVKDYLG